MALTLGTGPFGKQAAGTFNFERPDGTVIYWEDSPKRFRIEIGGRTVADNRGVKLLHETGHLMQLYFPREDVKMDLLKTSGKTTQCPHKGDASYYSMTGSAVDNVAWSYEEPLAHAPPMKDYLTFDLEKVGDWFEEEERGYAHPRDPYHRVDVAMTSRHVVARVGREIVAETGRPAMLFETSLPPRYYFSPDDVRSDHLEKSETVTDCPYKGPAQHWHAEAGGERIEDAAWSLADLIGDATKIVGWFCFYPGKVETEVDGEILADQ